MAGAVDSKSAAAQAEIDDVEVRNPATGLVVGRVPNMSAVQVAELASVLRAAQPAWEALGPRGRAVHLRNWLNWMMDNNDQLLRLVQSEAGKSWGDTSIETIAAVEVINYSTKHAEKFLADRRYRPLGVANVTKKLELHYRPYQLVGVITPWNYPLGMPIMDVPQALMAGAAVLTKPSEDTPLAWREAVRAWNEEIGAPPVLGCVTGMGPTGAAVVDQVDMIQFTGSTDTGRRVAVRAAERLIPASLELGGNDAMIVLSDADIDRAARGAAWGGFFNAGQSCIAVERVYVEAPVYDKFVERLVAEAGSLRQGMDPAGSFTTDLGAMANEKQIEIVERHVQDAVDKGARVLTGGKRAQQGLFFPPTVLVDVDHTMACMREETFGPILGVMKVSGEQEAVRLANDSHLGLAGSVWTASQERARRVGQLIEAGGISVNNASIHIFQFPLPMGGWKQSGLGARFGGADGMLKYCRKQAFVSDRLRLKSELHWYPHSPGKGRFTDRMVRMLGMHDWVRRLGR
ncbi:aldehyde dehydrogenase family protein [Mycobacterium syngnathidarum]